MNYINTEDRIRLVRKQNFAALRLRLCALITKPWKFVLVFPFAILFVYAWNCHKSFTPYNNNPILSSIYNYLGGALLVILFTLCLIALLYRLSIPLYTKKYEDSLLKVGLVAHDGTTPVLIARKKIAHTKAYKLTFFSQGVSKEIWEQRKIDIEDALNFTFIEPIEYGGKNRNNRNLIVLTVTSNFRINRKEVLIDDEF